MTRCENVAAAAEALLDELVAYVRRYVVLKDSQAETVALWIMHTHAIDAADVTPYLAILSAEKRSGKSRLLEVLSLLVARPLPPPTSRTRRSTARSPMNSRPCFSTRWTQSSARRRATAKACAASSTRVTAAASSSSAWADQR